MRPSAVLVYATVCPGHGRCETGPARPLERVPAAAPNDFKWHLFHEYNDIASKVCPAHKAQVEVERLGDLRAPASHDYWSFLAPQRPRGMGVIMYAPLEARSRYQLRAV